MKFLHSDLTAYRMLLYREGMHVSAKFNVPLPDISCVCWPWTLKHAVCET